MASSGTQENEDNLDDDEVLIMNVWDDGSNEFPLPTQIKMEDNDIADQDSACQENAESQLDPLLINTFKTEAVYDEDMKDNIIEKFYLVENSADQIVDEAIDNDGILESSVTEISCSVAQSNNQQNETEMEIITLEDSLDSSPTEVINKWPVIQNVMSVADLSNFEHCLSASCSTKTIESRPNHVSSSDSHIFSNSQNEIENDLFLNENNYVSTNYKTAYLNKKSDKATDNSFRCDFCLFTTKTRFALARHITMHSRKSHTINSISDSDSKVTSSSPFLNKLDNLSTNFTCHLCSFSTKTRFALARHVSCHTNVVSIGNSSLTDIKPIRNKEDISLFNETDNDKSNIFKCHLCSFFAKTRFALARHAALHSDSDSTFNDAQNVSKMANRDKITILKCTQCDYTAKSSLTLERHLTFHKQLQSSPGRVKFPKMAIKRHNQTQKEDYKCSKCSFVTKSSSYLKIHIEKNKDKKHCTSVGRPNGVKNSKKVADDAKRFKCTECNFSTTLEANLLCHNFLHTRGTPVLQCSYCPLKFTRCALVFHCKRTHKKDAGSIVYKCSQCPYITKFGKKLEEHILVHSVKIIPLHQKRSDAPSTVVTNARSKSATDLSSKADLFKCEFCSFCSKYYKGFRDHTSLHTKLNLPIFSCKYCDYKSTNMALARHVNTSHKGVTYKVRQSKNKKYKCSKCTFTTKHEISFDLHMKKNKSRTVCRRRGYNGRRSNKILKIATKKLTNNTNQPSIKSDSRLPIQSNGLQDRATGKETFAIFKYDRKQTKAANVGSANLLKEKNGTSSRGLKNYENKITTLNIKSESNNLNTTFLYICEICSFVAQHKEALISHKVSHSATLNEDLKKIKYSPPNSQMKTVTLVQSIAEKDKHYRKDTSLARPSLSELYRCQTCSFSSKFRSLVEEHSCSEKVKEKKPYQCSKCNYNTKYKNCLQTHIKQLHKDFFLTKNCYNDRDRDGLIVTVIEETMENQQFIKKEDDNWNPKQTLDKEFQNKFVFLNSEYSCKQCSFVTKHEHLIKAHLLLQCGFETTFHKCHKCNYKTKVKVNLKMHLAVHTKNKSFTLKYQCGLCDYQGGSLGDIKQHKHTIHTNYLKCQSCDYKTKSPQGMSNHKRLLHKAKSEINKDKESKDNAYDEVQYKCDDCDFKTNRKHNLLNHKTVHIKIKEIKVYKNKTYNFKLKEQNYKTKHQSSPHFCRICSYTSVIKYDFERHLKTHKKINKSLVESCKDDGCKEISKIKKPGMYSCKNCPFKADNRYSVLKHQRAHIKRFSCDLCPYKVHSEYFLNKHTNLHSEKGTVSCKICGYLTLRKDLLVGHLRRHKRDVINTCEFCPFTTNDKSSLYQHQRIHTKNQIFRCAECSCSFYLWSKYIKHMRIHQTPYLQCEVCSFKCNDKNTLQCHLKTHNINDKEIPTPNLINILKMENVKKNFKTTGSVKLEVPLKKKITLNEKLPRTKTSSSKLEFKNASLSLTQEERKLKIKENKLAPAQTEKAEDNLEDSLENLLDHIEVCSVFENPRDTPKEKNINDLAAKKPNNTGTQFSCKHCQYKTNIRFKLNQHYQKKHDSHNEQCSYNSSTKKKTSKVIRKNTSKKAIFKCSICFYKSKYRRMVDKHFQACHVK